MNLQEHTQPDKLERYSFIWSEVRLIIAALALFLGGIPPLLFFIRIASLSTPLNLLLKLAWIVSGAAAAYLLYRWMKSNKTVFGGKDKKDVAAFFVSVVSGLNLGITGLLGQNIGMSLSSNKLIFIIVGVIYLAAAYHLYRRFTAQGKRVF